jgi:hypothetical protein
MMAWLAQALGGPSQAFVLETLEKLPHPKRARHVEVFRALLPGLEAQTAEQLQNAFGPVLGGLPKHAQKKGGKPEPKEATGEDLQRLKSFFDKFGGAR